MTTFNNFPCKYGKICPKNPQKTFVLFACIFFQIATMQKFTHKKPLTTTLPNSQVPNSSLGATKNPTMRQGISLSFHNFWANRAKVIIVLRV
jgi:hypothetical protein